MDLPVKATVKTEYQFKIDTEKVQNETIGSLISGLKEQFKGLSFEIKEKKPKIFQIVNYEMNNIRLSLKRRLHYSPYYFDLTLKHHSPSLGELLALDIKSKQIEQDIYGQYTKFTAKFRKDFKERPRLYTMGDIKKIFPKSFLLQKMDSRKELVFKTYFLYRNETFFVCGIAIVLDLYFPTFQDSLGPYLPNISRGEYSFKISSKDKNKSSLAIRIYGLIRDLSIFKKNYKNKPPGAFY